MLCQRQGDCFVTRKSRLQRFACANPGKFCYQSSKGITYIGDDLIAGHFLDLVFKGSHGLVAFDSVLFGLCVWASRLLRSLLRVKFLDLNLIIKCVSEGQPAIYFNERQIATKSDFNQSSLQVSQRQQPPNL